MGSPMDKPISPNIHKILSPNISASPPKYPNPCAIFGRLPGQHWSQTDRGRGGLWGAWAVVPSETIVKNLGFIIKHGETTTKSNAILAIWGKTKRWWPVTVGLLTSYHIGFMEVSTIKKRDMNRDINQQERGYFIGYYGPMGISWHIIRFVETAMGLELWNSSALDATMEMRETRAALLKLLLKVSLRNEEDMSGAAAGQQHLFLNSDLECPRRCWAKANPQNWYYLVREEFCTPFLGSIFLGGCRSFFRQSGGCYQIHKTRSQHTWTSTFVGHADRFQRSP